MSNGVGLEIYNTWKKFQDEKEVVPADNIVPVEAEATELLEPDTSVGQQIYNTWLESQPAEEPQGLPVEEPTYPEAQYPFRVRQPELSAEELAAQQLSGYEPPPSRMDELSGGLKTALEWPFDPTSGSFWGEYLDVQKEYASSGWNLLWEDVGESFELSDKQQKYLDKKAQLESEGLQAPLPGEEANIKTLLEGRESDYGEVFQRKDAEELLDSFREFRERMGPDYDEISIPFRYSHPWIQKAMDVGIGSVQMLLSPIAPLFAHQGNFQRNLINVAGAAQEIERDKVIAIQGLPLKEQIMRGLDWTSPDPKLVSLMTGIAKPEVQEQVARGLNLTEAGTGDKARSTTGNFWLDIAADIIGPVDAIFGGLPFISKWLRGGLVPKTIAGQKELRRIQFHRDLPTEHKAVVGKMPAQFFDLEQTTLRLSEIETKAQGPRLPGYELRDKLFYEPSKMAEDVARAEDIRLGLRPVPEQLHMVGRKETGFKKWIGTGARGPTTIDTSLKAQLTKELAVVEGANRGIISAPLGKSPKGLRGTFDGKNKFFDVEFGPEIKKLVKNFNYEEGDVYHIWRDHNFQFGDLKSINKAMGVRGGPADVLRSSPLTSKEHSMLVTPERWTIDPSELEKAIDARGYGAEARYMNRERAQNQATLDKVEEIVSTKDTGPAQKARNEVITPDHSHAEEQAAIKATVPREISDEQYQQFLDAAEKHPQGLNYVLGDGKWEIDSLGNRVRMPTGKTEPITGVQQPFAGIENFKTRFEDWKKNRITADEFFETIQPDAHVAASMRKYSNIRSGATTAKMSPDEWSMITKWRKGILDQPKEGGVHYPEEPVHSMTYRMGMGTEGPKTQDDFKRIMRVLEDHKARVDQADTDDYLNKSSLIEVGEYGPTTRAESGLGTAKLWTRAAAEWSLQTGMVTLAKLGGLSPTAKLLGRMTHTLKRNTDRLVGSYEARIKKAYRPLRTNPKKDGSPLEQRYQEIMYKAFTESETVDLQTLSAPLRFAIQETRSILNEIGDTAVSSGMYTYDPKLEGFRKFALQSDYLPTVVKDEFRKKGKLNRLREDMVKSYVDANKGVDEAFVNLKVAQLMHNHNSFVSGWGGRTSTLNFADGKMIPEKYKVKNIEILVNKAINDSVPRIEAAHMFGIDAIGQHPKLQNMYKDIRGELAGVGKAQYAKITTEQIDQFSREGVNSQMKMIENLMEFQLNEKSMQRTFLWSAADFIKMIASLRFLSPHSGIANMTQTVMGVPIQGNAKALFNGMREVFSVKGTAKARSDAMRAGVIFDAAMNDLMIRHFGGNKIGLLFGKYFTFIPKTEEFNRIIAYHSGRDYIQQLAFDLRKARQENKIDKIRIIERRMQDLTIDPGSIASDYVLNERQLQDAGYEFNILVNFSADPLRNPTIAYSPVASAFYQFKNFPMHRARQINRELGKQFIRAAGKDGNSEERKLALQTLLNFTVSTGAGGAVFITSDKMKQLGTYLYTGVIRDRWNWNPDEELTAARMGEMAIGSSMGMYYGIIAAARYDLPEIFGGPPISLYREIEKTVGRVGRGVTRGQWDDVLRAFETQVPVLGKYAPMGRIEEPRPPGTTDIRQRIRRHRGYKRRRTNR